MWDDMEFGIFVLIIIIIIWFGDTATVRDGVMEASCSSRACVPTIIASVLSGS